MNWCGNKVIASPSTTHRGYMYQNVTAPGCSISLADGSRTSRGQWLETGGLCRRPRAAVDPRRWGPAAIQAIATDRRPGGGKATMRIGSRVGDQARVCIPSGVFGRIMFGTASGSRQFSLMFGGSFRLIIPVVHTPTRNTSRGRSKSQMWQERKNVPTRSPPTSRLRAEPLSPLTCSDP